PQGAGDDHGERRQGRQPGHHDGHHPGEVEKRIAHPSLVQRFGGSVNEERTQLTAWVRRPTSPPWRCATSSSCPTCGYDLPPSRCRRSTRKSAAWSMTCSKP